MSEKRFFGFAEFSTWVSEKVDGVLASVAASLGSKVDKTDDFGQYKVGELELAVLLADLASGADLATLQQGFNDFVAAKASTAEAIAGTDDAKYLTAVGAKAAIEAAVNDLVGSAPEAMNTIMELATALENNPDVIQDLVDMVDTRFSQVHGRIDQVHGRIDGIDELMLTKASQDQMDTAFGLINEKAAQSSLDSTADGLMGAINAISSVLGSKLDATGTATNATRLENSTKAEVIAAAVSGAEAALADDISAKLDRTAQASDSAKLEGATKAGVIAEAVAAANLGTIASSDIYVSTVDPLPTDGKNGDLWIKYTP